MLNKVVTGTPKFLSETLYACFSLLQEILCSCLHWLCCCYICCSVTQSCLTLCDPWTAAHQISLSLTISWSLPKFTFISLVMPSSHLILCRPLFLLPPSGTFPMSHLFASDVQNTGASALVFPMNIQCCSPLRLTGSISLLSKGLSGVFSSTRISSRIYCYLFFDVWLMNS